MAINIDVAKIKNNVKCKQNKKNKRNKKFNHYENHKYSKHVKIERQNILLHEIEGRKTKIFESFWLNIKIYVTLFICVICLSLKMNDNTLQNINHSINGLFYLIIAMILGWVIHYLAHYYNGILFLENKPMNYYFKSILNFFSLIICDFHSLIHHDTTINKKPIYIIGEFLSNFYMEGGYIIASNYLFNWNINTNVFWLWALTYASVHNINYNLYPPECHVQHHKDPNTNLGIDTLDVIFGTKYDYDCLEDFNHGSINVIIITILLLYLRNKNILTI